MLIAVFAGVANFAFTQKPKSGNITTEIGLILVNGTPATAANPAGIAYEVFWGLYFLSEGMTVRGSFGLGMGSTTTVNPAGGGTTNLCLNALVGAELGVGLFGSSSKADTETETVVGGVTAKGTVPGDKGSNFGINPNALGLVRIGLMF